MLSKDKSLDEIRNDLKDLELMKFDAVVYGSYVRERSIRDIDIAVITRIRDKEKNLKIWYDLIGKIDLRVIRKKFMQWKDGRN